MPDHAPRGPEPMRSPDQARPPAHDVHQPTPSTAPTHVQSLGRAAGNRAVTHLLGEQFGMPGANFQRVKVNQDMGGETIYENPDLRGIAAPTAAQKQFVATSYSLSAKYDMTRQADAVYIKIRIQFVDQGRGTKEFKVDATGATLLDAAGKPVPDPDYRQNVGKISEIKDAERIDFAKARCTAIGASWDHYKLVSKEKKVDDIRTMLGIKVPEPQKIDLPLKFQAIPVFDVSAKDTHTTIRLFGKGTDAKRDGAHPIDAGHWYMDYKTNYGDMNVDAIAAHEYGHLLGLPDEYSISNDQAHQILHRSGGGGPNAGKELDQHTARQMVAAALWTPLSDRMSANLAKVGANITKAKSHLGAQLAKGLRRTWADAGVRLALRSSLEPALATKQLKRAVPGAIAFESGANFSNVTLANKAMLGFTADAIKREAMAEAGVWINGVLGKTFDVKGADKTVTKFSSSFSANVWQAGSTGAGAASAKGAADTFIGTAGAGLSPKLPPSATLLQQLEALPAHWKAPGKGLDTAYTPGVLTPKIEAAVKTAISGGIIPKIKSVSELYRVVLNLVESAASATADAAVATFVKESVRPKVRDQLAVLQKAIDNEVDASMGLGPGGIVAKSAYPNLQRLATSLYTTLKSQQTAGADKQKATLNAGSGSAGQDVKYTATSMMGTNNLEKDGFRTEMIAPVVSQFNAHAELKHANEEDFKADKR